MDHGSKNKEETILLFRMDTYGGIGTINLWLSDWGFNPNGDEIMAFSNSLRDCKRQSQSIMVHIHQKYTSVSIFLHSE